MLRSKLVDGASPIAYGYSDETSVYGDAPPVFTVSNMAGGRGGFRFGGDNASRPTGRGTAADHDQPEGRPPAAIPNRPRWNGGRPRR